jgi:hypothetical protein
MLNRISWKPYKQLRRWHEVTIRCKSSSQRTPRSSYKNIASYNFFKPADWLCEKSEVLSVYPSSEMSTLCCTVTVIRTATLRLSHRKKDRARAVPITSRLMRFTEITTVYCLIIVQTFWISQQPVHIVTTVTQMFKGLQKCINIPSILQKWWKRENGPAKSFGYIMTLRTVGRYITILRTVGRYNTTPRTVGRYITTLRTVGRYITTLRTVGR